MLPPNITLPTPLGIHSRKLHASETPAENQFLGVTILNYGPARTWGLRQNPPPNSPNQTARYSRITDCNTVTRGAAGLIRLLRFKLTERQREV